MAKRKYTKKIFQSEQSNDLKNHKDARCLACVAKDEMMAHMREEIRTLQSQNSDTQNRFMALVPDAMTKYHQLKLTETASMKPEAMSGIIPNNQVIPEEDGLDGWFDQLESMPGLNGPKPGQKKNGRILV